MKETIYDLLNKYQITFNISEELTDTELGYLYLKMKSDIVNNCFDVLKEQYKRKDLFNANLKILFELAIDYPYRASFSNNLKEAISMFVVSGREILKEDKDDEDFLTLINYDENLINLYGNPQKQVESIIFNYDRPYPFEFAMGASRSEYEYYTRSFNGDITLKDLIEEHIVFMIDGYYKMFVKEDNKETLIAEIYSVFGKNTSISLFIDNCRLENVFSNKNNIKQHSIECRVLKLTKNQLAQKGISVINTNAYLTVNRIDCLNINNILHKKGILHE